ncbi:MAG: hypothetical protein HS115_20320 [Spirochaetales bacterium]|nr:hypothetical protein [Spirochaetales bacterium]
MKSFLYLIAGSAFFLCLIIFYVLSPANQAGSPDESPERLTLFDTAFWTTGSDGAPDFDRLAGQINPLTGEPYSTEQIERIRKLWQLFPQNSLLPQPALNRFRQEKEEERRQNILRDLSAGEATEADAAYLFEVRRQEILDRIQLVEHVLTEDWPADTLNGYRTMLERDQQALKDLQEEKASALSILRKRREGASAEPPAVETRDDPLIQPAPQSEE